MRNPAVIMNQTSKCNQSVELCSVKKWIFLRTEKKNIKKKQKNKKKKHRRVLQLWNSFSNRGIKLVEFNKKGRVCAYINNSTSPIHFNSSPILWSAKDKWNVHAQTLNMEPQRFEEFITLQQCMSWYLQKPWIHELHCTLQTWKCFEPKVGRY